MRISCEEDDPGYLDCHNIVRVTAKVYLDGVEIRDVVTADEEEGMLVRYCRKDNGLLIVENGIVLRETLHGVVELH